MSSALPPAEPLNLASLVGVTPGGISSRILAKTSAGSVTLFAFDGGQGLSEHTSPFDALVIVQEGEFTITVGGVAASVAAGHLMRLPANVPHGLEALTPSRLLLVMLKEA